MAAYLFVTLPLLVARADRVPLVLVAHLAVLGWVLLVRRRGRLPGRAEVLGDWSFPLLVPLGYAELPVLMEGLPGPVRYRDADVRRLEEALFGGMPAWEWAGTLPLTWLSELLHLGYLLYYPLIYLPPLLLYLGLTGPRREGGRKPGPGRPFESTLLAMALAFVPAYLVMVAFPVQGPRYLGSPAGVQEGPVRSLVLLVLESGSSRGAAFPSSHVSLAVAQSLVALRWQPRPGVAASVVTVLLTGGAVYGGFHYAVDAVAGAVLGVAAAGAALAWAGRNPAPRAGFEATD